MLERLKKFYLEYKKYMRVDLIMYLVMIVAFVLFFIIRALIR